jgi:hypothetical protein
MQTIATIGLDIAKSVFQVHGVDAAGQVVIRRQLKRGQVLAFFAKLPPCLIGIEACASSHHWARELQAVGHTVRMIPPAYVKPYVKRQKNDAADAEAICEAVTRPNMRFVPTKTLEQQGCLVLHRTRHLFIRQQTAVINSIRAHLAEFGIVAPVGRRGVERLLEVVADANDARVPEVARACVAALGVQLRQLNRHHDIVEQGNREFLLQEALHQCEIEAHAHPILVAFAVERRRWKKPALVEIDREVKLAFTWCKLCRKLDLIVVVDGAVKGAEVTLDALVQCVEFCLHGAAVNFVSCLGSFARCIRVLVTTHRGAVVVQTKLCGR